MYCYQVHDVSGPYPIVQHFPDSVMYADGVFGSLVTRLNAEMFKPSTRLRGEGIIAVAVDRTKLKTVAFIKRVKLKSAKTHAPLPLVWLAFPTADHREKFRAHVEQRYAPGSTNLEAFTWSGHRYVMSVDCVNTECLEGIKLDAVTNFNGLLCDGNGKIKLDYSNESTDAADAHRTRYDFLSDLLKDAKNRWTTTLSSKVAERVDAVIHEEMCNAAFGKCNLPRTPMTFVEACEVLKIRAKGSHIDALAVTNAIRTVLAYVTK